MKTRLSLLLLLGLDGAAALGAPLRFVGAEFPFILEYREGKPAGLAVSVIRDIAEHTGLDYTISIVPWARAQALVESGRADVLIGPYRTKEREARMTFMRWPLYIDTLSWYALKESRYTWSGKFSELGHLRLGVTRAWTLGQSYEASKRRLQIETADTMEQNFGKLALGRLDLVACNERTARFLVKRMQPRLEIQALKPPISHIGGYFAHPRAPVDADSLARFETALGELARSGRLQALSRLEGLDYPGPRTKWAEYLAGLS
ncbi:substrate-binding periplasmic protein [Paludibacterium paludis]|uniref:substrate-binding periplasmic protein n=1 Tax=Paludibacterium paludis TaxID=1225769 RepID=UPI0016742BA5|nr:transporter substrate-binding domain-containing protein [Paludibacterium paludis]